MIPDPPEIRVGATRISSGQIIHLVSLSFVLSAVFDAVETVSVGLVLPKRLSQGKLRSSDLKTGRCR